MPVINWSTVITGLVSTALLAGCGLEDKPLSAENISFGQAVCLMTAP